MLLDDTTKGWEWQFSHMFCFFPPYLVPLNWRSNFLSFSPGTCTAAVISTASESAQYLLDEGSSDSLGHPWKFVSTCPRNLAFMIHPAVTDYETKETEILEPKYIIFPPSLTSVYCKMFLTMLISLINWAFLKKSGKILWWFTALICSRADSGLYS